MISTLSGAVTAHTLDTVVVEVGGVGLLVHTTPATAAALRPGQTASLATTLIVREDALTLYGFDSARERDLFEMVQAASGIGPRIALAMLAVHAPDVLVTSIAAGDLVTLVKVPGIGRKGAERIVLELKDKVVALGAPADTPTVDVPAAADERTGQVIEALVGLGWSAKQAGEAVERVDAHSTNDAGALQVAELLRAALRELGR